MRVSMEQQRMKMGAMDRTLRLKVMNMVMMSLLIYRMTMQIFIPTLLLILLLIIIRKTLLPLVNLSLINPLSVTSLFLPPSLFTSSLYFLFSILFSFLLFLSSPVLFLPTSLSAFFSSSLSLFSIPSTSLSFSLLLYLPLPFFWRGNKKQERDPLFLFGSPPFPSFSIKSIPAFLFSFSLHKEKESSKD